MTKSAKPSTLKVPRRDGKSSIRRSKSVRLRGVSLNLESLEQRTLLSISSSTEQNLTGNSISTSLVQPPSSTVDLPSGLQESVADKGVVATVVAPNTPTAAATSHIYTGQPSSFTGPLKGTAGSSSTSPTALSGQLDPNQAAALKSLSGALGAQPQYMVMPTSSKPSNGSNPLDFEGPAGGYAPAQIVGAYGVVGDGAGQTIALIDFGDYAGFVNSTDPNFSSSALAVFDRQFGLPDPPSFTKFNEFGQTSPLPPPFPGAGLEIALDVEWAHAIAPKANIILVESSNNSFANTGQAANTAATLLHASVVSQSFGGFLEFNGDGAYEQFLDQTYFAPALAANPNVTFLAATGDDGENYGPIYPSISPLNVAVGGTTLNITGTTWDSESSWSLGGGGPSNTFPPPSYQQGVSAFGFGPLTSRTAPDISADANGLTGVSVYDPVDYGGWVKVGGTSVATPITAGMIGIADADRVALGGQPLNGPNQTLPALYSSIDYTKNFHDITTVGPPDNNPPKYQVGPGYDLPTGIGSPQAGGLLPTLALFDLGPAVVSSDPATGQVLTTTPPTTFSLTFSEPIVPSSVEANDFTVDGTPADGDTLSPDDMTITYTFDTSPVVTQGLQTMDLPADSVIGADDGQFNHEAFTTTFFYVTNQLQVISTSPPVGSVLTIPGNIDLVVHFNEAINPFAISTSDFQVSQGTVLSAVPLTPEAVDLTIGGVTQDGTLTLTVPAGVLFDMFGVPNLGFTGTYITDIVSEPYPTPLQAQLPLGSLIYDPSVTGSIGFVGDTDTYTLGLAAGQTLSLALTVDAGLIGTVTLEGPGGTTIGSATGSGPGATVVLESAPIATAGTYSLIVGGSGGTTGAYTLQAILNAAYKPSTLSNNTIGTAFDLSSSFGSLGTTPFADRAGVVGTLGTTPTDFYAISLTAGEVLTIADKGTNGTASVALYDSSGDLLTDGIAGNGVDSIISVFVAQSTGTYYADVTGATGLGYDLVAVRGGDFDLHGNSFANAQPLDGASVVLGDITKSTGSLFVLDDQLYNTYNPIFPTDPATGVFTGPSIPAPGDPLNNPFGLNLAYDGVDLYYNDGQFDGNNEIYKLDPATGAVLASVIPPSNVPPLAGLAYLNGLLYGTAGMGFGPTQLYVFDPTTLAYETTINVPITDSFLSGLTGDPDLGVLWAVAQVGTGVPVHSMKSTPQPAMYSRKPTITTPG